jgi:hypothetical protein
MKRFIAHRRHRLSFEIPSENGADYLWFLTHESVSGVEVGYDVQPELDYYRSRGKSIGMKRFINRFCPKDAVQSVVRNTLKWISKLQFECDNFYIQFVPSRSFGGDFYARGVPGKRKRSLLMLEFIIDPRGMLIPVDDYCEDVIPHELMHIKDVLDCRSPTIFPYLIEEHGAWVDLFRHLWIDGYLDQIGLPHMPKKLRLKQINETLRYCQKEASLSKISKFCNQWWGKPMTFKEAIEIGLDFGLPLEKECPISKWYLEKK